jgi:hypothetical protein
MEQGRAARCLSDVDRDSPRPGSAVVPLDRELEWPIKLVIGVTASGILPTKLRVTAAETDHMPVYLRRFFEYCPVGCAGRNRGVGPGSPFSSHRWLVDRPSPSRWIQGIA